MQIDVKKQAMISNGRHAITQLNTMLGTVYGKMCDNDIQPAIPVAVSINDGLSLTALGVTVVAKPRLVRSQGQFLYEFVFNGLVGDKAIEVWRFYLTMDGSLFETHDCQSGTRICDYNNEYVKSNIANPLLERLLDSSLFDPSPTA